MLYPGDFIAIAERYGLIGQINAWVLREASREGAAWQAAHLAEPPLSISVNVSASECRHASLADSVHGVLGQHPLAPDSLLLEITETTELLDPQGSAALLDAIRGMGVRLALDDFGAGSHALSHLRHLPLDALKLDRTFVGALDDPRTAAIVAAVITLAHELEMDVIAQGVETTEQAQALRRLGCDLAQGTLLSVALPASEAAALLLRVDAPQTAPVAL